MKLLLATHNPGKIKEMRALLEMPGLELVTPAEIDLVLSIPETGSTYAENASLKAKAFAKVSRLLTLADDSGLEVDALDGQPGVHSARFVDKPGATDADRRRRLIDLLQGRPRPWTARFRCLVALVEPGGEVHFREGVCEGEVIPDERGRNGFGYDPVFLIPALDRTMAELSMPEKNRLSHRARAVFAARPILGQYLAIS